MRKGNTLSKLLSVFIVAVMALCGTYMPWAGDTHEAYAKERGQKNRQACDHCNDVLGDKAPQGYSSVIPKSVYSGGNSYSKESGFELDKDPTDFAKPLPYGNVYVDAGKLNWNDPNGFIIDIQDKRFAWVAVGEELTDKEGNKSTTDPMGDIRDPKPNDPLAPFTPKPLTGKMRGICYVGPLQSYLTNITDKAKTGGKTNVINTETTGKPYLYRITYLDAVTLPNGTKGNLVLTMNSVEIETSVTVDSTHPFTPSGAAYSYTNALIKVQGENQLGNDTGYNFKDADGRDVNQRTSEITGGNTIRNATGNILDLDIEIQDTEGNPVEGTISYAAHDMDFESVQNVWGRPLGDDFSESLMIVSGSQSYALVPDYSKLVDGEKVFYKDDENAITRETGWPPVGPEKDQLDRVLDIQKVGSGSHANGIRFASPFLASYRDADGDFSDAIFRNGEVCTYQGDTLASNTNIILNENGGNPITNSAKQQIYSMLDEDDRPASWRDVTAELAWNKLGPYFWKTYRNDDDKSYDSGFAVLIDAKKTQIRWTGSRAMGSNLNTTLFDPTLYTYVQQTHGTGGGIYLESYSLTDNCEPIPMEGVVTMARDTDVTFTAVPEDGYKVKTIRVGGVGLSDPITYDVNKLKFIDNIYEDPENGVTIEKNSDGTYDVTVANIDKPRHVHADFTADYYFYKVWKKPKSSSKKIPKKLELTATPFVYEMTSVTVDGVKYTISDEGTSYTANGVTHHMTATSNVKLGEGDDAEVYTLVGHDLVDSDGNKYPIKSEIKKGKAKKFTISSTGSDVSKGFVKVTKDSKGNTVWKVKYPEDGRTATSGKWPVLPIETYDGDEHNYNHIQRNYWFVTETVPPGWNESYDNTEALTPGVVTAKDGDGTFWKEQATIYHDPASELIASKDDNDHAFMSPLSTAVKRNGISYTGWGGEILNEIPDPASKPTDPNGPGEDEEEGKKVLGTGDNAILPIAIAALIAAALGVALVIGRRRKYN